MNPNPPAPPDGLAHRVTSLMSAAPRSWRPVARGYTGAGRWVVDNADGSSCFVKAATDAETSEWLRAEMAIYGNLAADWLPRVLGWEDEGGMPILLLEDLSGAHWPPPWSGGLVERVLELLELVHSSSPPSDIPPLEALREELSGWSRVARDPAPFLSLGLCSRAWLEAALPLLLEAQEDAVLEGDELVHADVRSDNVCFAGARSILVDWNWAARGNGAFDAAAWASSLTAERGPPPAQISPDQPELVALLCGYFASKAGLAPPSPGSLVREIQLTQLRVALPWVVGELALPPPEARPPGRAGDRA